MKQTHAFGLKLPEGSDVLDHRPRGGLNIELRSGLKFSASDAHSFIAFNKDELKDHLSYGVERCECEDCEASP